MAPEYVNLQSSETASVRLEIDEFIQDNALTNLFLLALDSLMKDYGENWWSYYNIAGIHGLPAEAWNGVQSGSGNSRTGYCSHSSGIFPTWHRAYVSMIEQSISDKVQEIAASFTTAESKQKHQEAARRFRLPYWDPLMPRKSENRLNWGDQFGLPKILSVEKVSVRRPENPKELDPNMDNPLHHYAFPNPAEKFKNNQARKFVWESLEKWGNEANKRTIRAPNLDKIIQDNASQLASGLYQLLNQAKTWFEFSNSMAARKGKQFVSLESWHDNIHGLVGGSIGHMGDPQYAAFDPIFWLHHCNIDRIFALYQAVWPHSEYATPIENGRSTFVANARTQEDGKTSLYPFRRPPSSSDSHEYWWSADEPIKNYTKAGYGIPTPMILQTKADIDDYKLRTLNVYNWISSEGLSVGAVRPKDLGYPKGLSHVEALQKPGPSRPLSTRALQNATPEQSEQNPVIKPSGQSVDTKKPGPIGGEDEVVADPATRVELENRSTERLPSGITIDDEKMRTWHVNMTVPKFAFNGSFNIDLFLGEVNDDEPDSYMTHPNHVGFTGVFANSADAECANCDDQRTQDLIYGDVIPLTATLTRFLRTNEREYDLDQDLRVLESLEPVHVVPFLTEKLEWRVTAFLSGVKDAQQVTDSGLELIVMDRIYHFPSEDNPFGSYDEPTMHPEITRGKAGGAPAEA